MNQCGHSTHTESESYYGTLGGSTQSSGSFIGGRCRICRRDSWRVDRVERASERGGPLSVLATLLGIAGKTKCFGNHLMPNGLTGARSAHATGVGDSRITPLFCRKAIGERALHRPDRGKKHGQWILWGDMKQHQTMMSRPLNGGSDTERVGTNSRRALFTATLLLLAGCSSKESGASQESPSSGEPATACGALVVPEIPAPQGVAQQPLTARQRRVQEYSNSRPSDVAWAQSRSTVRGLISDAVRDTQSVEMPIGKLRNGYTSHAEGIEEQRVIIASAARHSNRTFEEVAALIERAHQDSLTTLGLFSEFESLEAKLGLKEYARKRGELEEARIESREKIEQATIRANIDKIDRSLGLFGELKTLLMQKESGAPHDERRLKNLSRMCSASSLNEVNEIIPQLELLRTHNVEGDFRETVREESSRIDEASRKLNEIEEARNARWCAKYDEIVFMHDRLEVLRSRVSAAEQRRSSLPAELGNLVDSDKHTDLKMDLAEYKLRSSRLAAYSLMDAQSETVARIFDTGREFDEHRDVRYVRVAVDEPSTTLALKKQPQGFVLEGKNEGAFRKEVLDVRETARTEVDDAFRPVMIDQGSVANIILPGEKLALSVWMNPGAALDIQEASGGMPTEITLHGSGIVYVGSPSEGVTPLKVQVAETMEGAAPLLVSLPEGLSLKDIRHTQSSGTHFALSVGNATFERLGDRVNGRGQDLDADIVTPRGVQRIPLVRDGVCVIPGGR